MLVWIYSENKRDEFGAERWQIKWEQVKDSILDRIKKIQRDAKQLHEEEKHSSSDFGTCDHEACWKARHTEIDIDSDLDYYTLNFRGPNAKKKALANAKIIVDAGKTAFGVVMVRRQVVDWFVEKDNVADWCDTNDSEEVTS